MKVFTQISPNQSGACGQAGRQLYTDHKQTQPDGSGGISFYKPDIVSTTDYYPFGFAVSKRSFSLDGYRYGYQGSEKDDEVKGNGNSYTTEFRQLDPRLGRWLSVDPLADKYPSMSPFLYTAGNPIRYIDAYGLEKKPNRFERRYSWKKKRFEISGKAIHGKRLARYINRRGDKINKSNAYYNISTKNVYFDGYSSSTVSLKNPPKGKDKNLTGVNIVGGIVRGGTKDNIPFIKGPTGSSIKNIPAMIRRFDKHFDGDYWSFKFRDKFEKGTYKGLRIMTSLIFPIYAIFDRAFTVGNISSNRKENEKK